MNEPKSQEPSDETGTQRASLVACSKLHLAAGWWGLLLFLSLGIVLEALHALKMGWYLDVANDIRRLMFTLSHAHGTLLSLVNILFGLCALLLSGLNKKRMALASRCLLAGTVLLPGGFLLGGVIIHDGDPGLGVFLVPLGALVLLVAVFLAAISVTQREADQ